ncbi:MAG: hypothetical protein CMN03_05990 [Roseibacillus sp.]|nr:hypothetical protein [Roseibacillus sp.]
MLFRLTGIFLFVISVGAVIAHHAGLALPTLDWFFSFEAKDKGLESASWWKKYQANIIGYILCALLLAGGVLCLWNKSRKVKWNPQTLRKLKRFKSITRGYVSLWILAGLLFLTLLDQALVGKKALMVKYDGKMHFPAFVQRSYTEEDFGQEGKSEVDYHDLKEAFAKEDGGENWVLLPLVPYDATFDSEEPEEKKLTVRDGVFYQMGEKKPYSGLGYRYYADEIDKKKKHSMVRFRKGVRQGREEYYARSGADMVGHYEWKDGVRSAAPVKGSEQVRAVEKEEATEWQSISYNPLPPSLTTRHYLGTDSRGWDVLAQIYGGLQLVFQAAIIYLVVTYAIGITLGSLMGYLGGTFDIVVQRFIEILANVPFLYVVIIIASRIGKEDVSLMTILLVLCIFSWIGITYYMRTAAYREKARDYVAAARVLGAGPVRVIFRHVLPNAISIVVTLLPFSVVGVITALTALDFIGFGLPDTYPSWGRILQDGVSNLGDPWIVASVFGGMVSVLLLVTFVGEAVREAFDPKKFTTYR